MTRPLRWIAPFAAAAVLAACGSTSLHPSPPSVVVPDALRPPVGETLLRTLSADGVQVYECRAKAGDANAAEWVFVAPEARLFDADGRLVGRHYAGPTWEAGDGSKVAGTVRAKVDAPAAGAIAWLLLATHSTGKTGLFARVSSIQRVATQGGVAPARGCGAATVGQTTRVPYTAQYVQFAPTL
jgi:hypothetical protein